MRFLTSGAFPSVGRRAVERGKGLAAGPHFTLFRGRMTGSAALPLQGREASVSDRAGIRLSDGRRSRRALPPPPGRR